MEPKILGLSNTEDIMWHKLSPGDETLKRLDDVFDIYDNLWQEEEENIHSYRFQVESESMYFHKETDSFIVYFIFTEHVAHVLLRKTLNWQEFNEGILERFPFKA